MVEQRGEESSPNKNEAGQVCRWWLCERRIQGPSGEMHAAAATVVVGFLDNRDWRKGPSRDSWDYTSRPVARRQPCSKLMLAPPWSASVLVSGSRRVAAMPVAKCTLGSCSTRPYWLCSDAISGTGSSSVSRRLDAFWSTTKIRDPGLARRIPNSEEIPATPAPITTKS